MEYLKIIIGLLAFLFGIFSIIFGYRITLIFNKLEKKMASFFGYKYREKNTGFVRKLTKAP